MEGERERRSGRPKPVVLINAWKRDLPTFLGAKTHLYTLGAEYANAVIDAGGTPLVVPHVDPADVDALIDRADALVLTGGSDLDPRSYGAADIGFSHDTDPDADRTEIDLVQAAARFELPLLAICRGMQVLNVAFGGTLHQEITQHGDTHRPLPNSPEEILAYRHPIRILDGSHLAGILGAGTRPVNSIHHQALDKIAPHFTVAAIAPDGVVEAIEFDGKWSALGIQWHPEKSGERQELALFEALLRQALDRLDETRTDN